jgi:hypothetical protein
MVDEERMVAYMYTLHWSLEREIRSHILPPNILCFLLAIIVCNGSTSTAKRTTAGPTSSTWAWILGQLVRFIYLFIFIYFFSYSSGFSILQFVVTVLLWFIQKLLPSTL